ncbi:MAG: RNase P/RNase MRP subunit p30 [Candidatus Methanohalarchaeum thermophilum]|uniref:Ribonuclease P protein component 3 n=1 Tax=Methanohalarchaeum thermophilum TaxID=1903181 RepID=A0A1Q6DVQ4_METT1|nr:MAG: RNase P/RNase MRP subunit p30 [Candidatus Methanohalarchaeum thermophilum]
MDHNKRYEICFSKEKDLGEFLKEAKGLNYSSFVFFEINDVLDIGEIETDFRVFKGIEIHKKDIGDIKSDISTYRSKVDYLAVKARDNRVKEVLSKDKRVDCLVDCFGRRNDFDYVVAENCKRNDVAIEFNFGKLLRCSGYERSMLVRKFHRSLKLVRKYGSPLILTMKPSTVFDLRGFREFFSLIKSIGFSKEDLIYSNNYFKRLIERNCEFDKDEFVEPGIEKV